MSVCAGWANIILIPAGIKFATKTVMNTGFLLLFTENVKGSQSAVRLNPYLNILLLMMSPSGGTSPT